MRSTTRRTWRDVLIAGLRIGGSVIVMLIVLLSVGKPFLVRTLNTNYVALYSSYMMPDSELLYLFLARYGWITWTLAGLGYLAGIHYRVLKRPKTFFLIFFGCISLLLWIFYVQYRGIQYTLHITTPVVLGLAAFIWTIWARPRDKVRLLTLVCCVIFISANLLIGFGFINLPPRVINLFSQPNPPLIRTDYFEVVRLINYLYDTVPPGENVYVVDSSYRMNKDLLAREGPSLFDDWQIIVLSSPQIDSRDFYPLEALLQADYVIVTDPYQYHLVDPNEQKVVKVIHEAFTNGWEIAEDFMRLPMGFNLEGGAHLRVYKRVRPTSWETTLRTFSKMKAYIGRRPGLQPDWIVINRPPIFLLKEIDDHSYRMKFRSDVSAEPPMIGLIYANDLPERLTVKGKWIFRKQECKGMALKFELRDPNGQVVRDWSKEFSVPPKTRGFNFDFEADDTANLVLTITPVAANPSGHNCPSTVEWTIK